jgi:hypothetical protein
VVAGVRFGLIDGHPLTVGKVDLLRRSG